MIKQVKNMGKVHVYTGNGKGKTTSALGLAIRAAGNGMNVFIGQFMKGEEYSEIKFLRNISNIELKQYGWEKCIRKENVNTFHKNKTFGGLTDCRKRIENKKYDLVILDEILVSIWFGLVKESEVIELINNKPDHCEVVLTGRYASGRIIELADLVTEMKCIKHYYNEGVLSRKGIEF